jgi:hypothetical protein
MIAGTAVRTAASVARGAVRAAALVGAHAAWWLDYRMRGRSRR